MGPLEKEKTWMEIKIAVRSGKNWTVDGRVNFKIRKCRCSGCSGVPPFRTEPFTPIAALSVHS